MDRHEATFEIDSKRDAYAVRTVLERVHDTIREESKTVREGSDEARELMAQFKSLRDAARDHRPGTLTITYEVSDEQFEG
ncbi:hypothetical protein ACOZ4N_04300 [Halorientalis pallida]|uniref:hypothetical protein n=1 Tax=Halorientalis pallida TaxID=2479928 RepID=UPI003C6ED3E3